MFVLNEYQANEVVQLTDIVNTKHILSRDLLTEVINQQHLGISSQNDIDHLISNLNNQTIICGKSSQHITIQ